MVGVEWDEMRQWQRREWQENVVMTSVAKCEEFSLSCCQNETSRMEHEKMLICEAITLESNQPNQ